MDNFQTGGTMVPELDKAKNQDFSEWITDLRGRKVILDYQLATEEFHALRCRNFTSNGRGGTRYMPFAFTQEGVAMLSGLLRSETAVQANIYIMRAFVKMRSTFSAIENLSTDVEHLKDKISLLSHYLEDTLREQNDINEDTLMQLQLINESIARMQVENTEKQTKRKRIGFK